MQYKFNSKDNTYFDRSKGDKGGQDGKTDGKEEEEQQGDDDEELAQVARKLQEDDGTIGDEELPDGNKPELKLGQPVKLAPDDWEVNPYSLKVGT